MRKREFFFLHFSFLNCTFIYLIVNHFYFQKIINTTHNMFFNRKCYGLRRDWALLRTRRSIALGWFQISCDSRDGEMQLNAWKWKQIRAATTMVRAAGKLDTNFIVTVELLTEKCEQWRRATRKLQQGKGG